MKRPKPHSFERCDTEQTQQRDGDHYIHPWAGFEATEECCLVVAESKGACVYDSDGNRYLDEIGEMWCVNIGYASGEMVRSIAYQARKLACGSPFCDTKTTNWSERVSGEAERAASP